MKPQTRISGSFYRSHVLACSYVSTWPKGTAHGIETCVEGERNTGDAKPLHVGMKAYMSVFRE